MTDALTGVSLSGALVSGGCSINGIHEEDSYYGFNLDAAINDISMVGRAVAISTTAPNTVKLAGTGDFIVGRLDTYELRTVEGFAVGAVATEGGMVLPIDPSVIGGLMEPQIGWGIQGTTVSGNATGMVQIDGTVNSGVLTKGTVNRQSRIVVEKVIAADNASGTVTVLFL